MILAGFFQTVEFFVIAALAAAAVVAYLCMPKARGEAVTHTVAGELGCSGHTGTPELTVEVRPDGSVVLMRTGITGITGSGAVSLAATVCGFDMQIEERRMRGFSNDAAIDSARFVLDFLAPDWYHVRYFSGDTGEFCTFSLHVRPGIRLRRQLKQ